MGQPFSEKENWFQASCTQLKNWPCVRSYLCQRVLVYIDTYWSASTEQINSGLISMNWSACSSAWLGRHGNVLLLSLKTENLLHKISFKQFKPLFCWLRVICSYCLVWFYEYCEQKCLYLKSIRSVAQNRTEISRFISSLAICEC